LAQSALCRGLVARFARGAHLFEVPACSLGIVHQLCSAAETAARLRECHLTLPHWPSAHGGVYADGRNEAGQYCSLAKTVHCEIRKGGVGKTLAVHFAAARRAGRASIKYEQSASGKLLGESTCHAITYSSNRVGFPATHVALGISFVGGMGVWHPGPNTTEKERPTANGALNAQLMAAFDWPTVTWRCGGWRWQVRPSGLKASKAVLPEQ